MQLSNKEYMDGHNLNRSDKYVKTKNSHGCFEINSMSCTSVHGYFGLVVRSKHGSSFLTIINE